MNKKFRMEHDRNSILSALFLIGVVLACNTIVLTYACGDNAYWDGRLCRKIESCNAGDYFNGYFCTPCQKGCKTCSSRLTIDQIYVKCDSCIPGYVLYGTTCQGEPCDYPCATCDTPPACATCMKGHYLSEDTCKPCPSHCTTCESNITCTSCEQWYYLSDHQCLICPDGCSSCDSQYRCMSCESNYVLDNEQCKICSDRCLSCGSLDWCNECKPSYRLMSGMCVSCPDKCSECVTDNKCISCSYPNYYVDNYSCVECSVNCSSCSSFTECTYCKTGFYGKHQCLNQCPTNCKDDICDMDGQCIHCTDGFNGFSCNKGCEENCRSCERITGACMTCATGSYLHKSKCVRCPEHCTGCTYSRCTECISGRWGERCEKVCSNCKHGTACDKSAGYCKECMDGMSGTWCKTACHPSCKTCQRYNTMKCTSCVANTYRGNKMSDLCNRQCPTNCQHSTCNDRTGNCEFGCIYGYYGNTCKCPRNCICDQMNECIACRDGFNDTSRNCECTYEKCVDSECSNCTNDTHFVQNNICCSCHLEVNNCEECTMKAQSGFGRCTKCNPGWSLSSNQSKCTKCPLNCKEGHCDPVTGDCSLGCNVGYWSTHCDIGCRYPCIECNNDTGNCTLCPLGKYSDNCVKSCPPSCAGTDNIPVCDIDNGTCTEGCRSLTIYGSHCQHECSSNCTDGTCEWETGYCISGCEDNRYGNTCSQECSQACATPYNGSRCHGNNGTCIGGCLDGNYGDMCKNLCSPNCSSMICEQYGGTCLLTEHEQTETEQFYQTSTGLITKIVLISFGIINLAICFPFVVRKLVHKRNTVRHGSLYRVGPRVDPVQDDTTQFHSIDQSDNQPTYNAEMLYEEIGDDILVRLGSSDRVEYEEITEQMDQQHTNEDADYLHAIGDKSDIEKTDGNQTEPNVDTLNEAKNIGSDIKDTAENVGYEQLKHGTVEGETIYNRGCVQENVEAGVVMAATEEHIK